MPSICRVAAPVSFSAGVAIFQIVPSGVRTTPPWPHSDLATGRSDVAPASRAASTRAVTVAGWDTVSARVNPRKPVVGSSDARRRSPVSRPKAVA